MSHHHATLVFTLSAAVLAFGCPSSGVDCAPLVDDGTRCVCPEGTVQIDDWVCELPDGGTIERPGRPDSGADASAPDLDAGVDADVVADAGGELDAAEELDAGVDATDSGTDASVADDAGFDAGPPPVPDLVIVCTTPPAIVGAGDEVEVDYEVANLGTAAATDIEVVLNGLWVAPAQLAQERVLSLTVGASRTGTLRFVAPANVGSGMNPFNCVVDPGASIAESDESNNTHSAQVSATGRADIAVTVGVIPTTIRPGTAVSFRVENLGPVRATFQWIFEGQLVGSPSRFEMSAGVVDILAGGVSGVVATGNVPGAGGMGQARFHTGLVGSFAFPDPDLSNNTVTRSGISFVP